MNNRFSRQPSKAKRPNGGNKTLDYSLFIKKAEQSMPITEYTTQHSFQDFLIADILKHNIAKKGYTTPSPIQDQAIPHLLQGRDVVGIANTGTGKTAAFLIPLINKIYFQKNDKVLIITPTRELATQIQNELEGFTHNMQISSVTCIGGVGMKQQIIGLKKRHQFVIGTPGRLKDLRKQGFINFSQYNNIVLDEVDRMLDMGFVHDIKAIISQLPERRQSLFFSATLSDSVKHIMHGFLKNPIIVTVKTQETSQNVDQDIVKMNGKSKIDVLHDLLIEDSFEKVLVFGRTKWGVEKLAKQLELRGFKVASLHGNKTQNQRQRALNEFRNNDISILLATDVASRGLDIEGVTHVINFDPPESYEDYVHRIGRTGRANTKGTALTFIE